MVDLKGQYLGLKDEIDAAMLEALGETRFILGPNVQAFEQEAADYLGLTRSTLEHYRWIGGGPSYRKHGGLVFYHIDDLIEWSERRKFKDSATRVRP